jgi:hypothetical protein
LPNKKPNVTRYAVADITESRQVDEQALFEQRGERTVQVGRFREPPKLLDEPDALAAVQKKFGNTPKRERTSAGKSLATARASLFMPKLQCLVACVAWRGAAPNNRTNS